MNHRAMNYRFSCEDYFSNFWNHKMCFQCLYFFFAYVMQSEIKRRLVRVITTRRILTDELWTSQDAEARPQFTNYTDRAKGDIKNDFELRMSIPVRLIPRNPPVMVRLHMNNYVIRPETFNWRLIIDIIVYRVISNMIEISRRILNVGCFVCLTELWVTIFLTSSWNSKYIFHQWKHVINIFSS